MLTTETAIKSDQINDLLTLITTNFSNLKWTGNPGYYRAELSNGYIQVTERVKMDDGMRGEIAFYIRNPQKRQIFSFGWHNQEQRNKQITHAYSEIYMIYIAACTALGHQISNPFPVDCKSARLSAS